MGAVSEMTELTRTRQNIGEAWRTFWLAAWLGWQIESNWADPFLFAIYSIARPVASVLILVVMYSVVTGGETGRPIFAYIYLGNALYILVGRVINGVSWAVIDDREHYRTLKHLFSSPLHEYFYLLGRGVSQTVIGVLSVMIVIGLGTLAFDLPISLQSIDWGLLGISLALGVVALAAIGVILGSYTLTMGRHFWQLGETVSGAFYLFSGAIFPLEVLPPALRVIGFALPVTYWLELSRRALLPEAVLGFPTFARLADEQLVGILAGGAVALVVLSVLIFRWKMHVAKARGMIDLETTY